jgi:phenylpyruvate tautomerase PptA (4-oxalocrotonate tautomerase family)
MVKEKWLYPAPRCAREEDRDGNPEEDRTKGSDMPIVTVTVRSPKTAAFKTSVLKAVHAALVASGVNPKDRFHRVIELGPHDFAYDPDFPDLTRPRTDDFVLIEILLGVGRSVRVKKAILAGIMDGLTHLGLDTEGVMVVFQDVPWENWSPGGGRMPHG